MDNKPRAYVVDDTRATLKIHSSLLEKSGYDVTTFDSVDDAYIAMQLNRPEEHRNPQALPDVLVTDNDTGPGRTGQELVSALTGSGVATVLVTSDQPPIDYVRRFKLGEALLKPVRGKGQLNKAIEDAKINALMAKLNIQQNAGGRGVTDES